MVPLAMGYVGPDALVAPPAVERGNTASDQRPPEYYSSVFGLAPTQSRPYTGTHVTAPPLYKNIHFRYHVSVACQGTRLLQVCQQEAVAPSTVRAPQQTPTGRENVHAGPEHGYVKAMNGSEGIIAYEAGKCVDRHVQSAPKRHR